MINKVKRCNWATNDPLYIEYHDKEWGLPNYIERDLFESLSLEGAQAGLSWITVLRKRERYREVFDNFEIAKVARFTEKKRERLLADAGIIRHAGKIDAFIHNAKMINAMHKEGEDFVEFVWSFVEGKPLVNTWRSMKSVPSQTPQSTAMSKALKKKGFKFVGPTTCYSFMQACGLINDHVTGCFRHSQVIISR